MALARKKNLPALNPVDEAALSSMQAELLLASGNATGAAAAIDKLSAKNPWSMLARARLSLAMGQPADVVQPLSAQIPFDTLQQELAAQILLTVAMLHLQPVASLRPELERISGAMAALQNQWPLAMLTAPDLDLLLTSAQQLGVPFPKFTATPTALIPASLQAVMLTPRETSILGTLATTGDRNEIARINFVSVNTVKSQLRTLYKKLGVTSREDALLVAHREHLLNRLPPE